MGNKSDKSTRKHHKQESQEVSPFPAGDHKTAKNRQESMIDKHETQIHKRSTALERLKAPITTKVVCLICGRALNCFRNLDEQ